MTARPGQRTPLRSRGTFGAGRRAQGGFTLVELLVGIGVGAIVLTMVFLMFFGSSSALRDGGNRALAVGQVEVVMQRLVREIQSANTTNPNPSLGLPTVLPTTLPLLPYGGTELFPYANYVDSSSALPMPAAPAARLFSQQVSQLPLAQSRWCPNPTFAAVPADASNSLVCYRVPSGTTTVHRITYRVDGTDLVRLDQSPITATTYTDTTPTPLRQVLMRGIRSVQFTYPTLLAQVQGSGSTAFDTQLSGMTTAARDTYLNATYRQLIAIRVHLGVISANGGRAGDSELRTTVQVRN